MSAAHVATDRRASPRHLAGLAPHLTNAATDQAAACEPDADGTTYEYDVTVGLLCCRDRDLIESLLTSLEAAPSRYRTECLLSDNGSKDGTRELVRQKFPYVRILENGINLGVAAGRNRLLWNSRAKYTLVLDADTLVQPGAVDALVQTAEQLPEAGIVCPKLLYRDQTLQLSCRPFPRFHHTLIEGPPYRRYLNWTGIPARVDLRNLSHDELMQVDCCYGAAMLIRNRLARTLGGFDEGFRYQYEDYDLCFRYKRAGHQVWYQPAAVVTHFYEREERGVFHPRLRSHLRSIFRFQVRNMWRLWQFPVLHRRDLDGDRVPRPQGAWPDAVP
jgi:N-acetylglucosaminyl-diphospho-decaprenol L-rhamnosyltransferase